MCVQAGNVISNNIYRADDKPLYRRGNRNLIIINVLAISLFIFAKIYYILRNKHRDRVWSAMTNEVRNLQMRKRIAITNRVSTQEREDYLKNTTETGSKRLDFRFAH